MIFFFTVQTNFFINAQGSFIISFTRLPPTTPCANKEFAVYLNDNYEMRSDIGPVNGNLGFAVAGVTHIIIIERIATQKQGCEGRIGP